MTDWAKDAAELSRRQDALLRARLKKNATFLVLFLALTSLLLKGMPLHSLWHPLGPIALIPTLYFFAATISNTGMLVHGVLLERELSKTRPMPANVNYVLPKPRSGRRRSRYEDTQI